MKNHGATWALGVVVVCLSLGCSSDDDGGGGFVGRWLGTHTSSTDSCIGDFNSDDAETSFNEIELRAAGDNVIEYVLFDYEDGVTETCVQKFQVKGNVATIWPNQPCRFGDPPLEQTFSEDRLTLSGDSLREVGTMQYSGSAGESCEQTFDVQMQRVR